MARGLTMFGCPHRRYPQNESPPPSESQPIHPTQQLPKSALKDLKASADPRSPSAFVFSRLSLGNIGSLESSAFQATLEQLANESADLARRAGRVRRSKGTDADHVFIYGRHLPKTPEKGRPPDEAGRAFILRLAALCEGYTGRWPTVTYSAERGEHCGPFVELVAACYRIAGKPFPSTDGLGQRIDLVLKGERSEVDSY